MQAAKALLKLGKRDLTSQISQKITTTEQPIDDPTINWEKIMRYDPLGCALSLICQLSASDELKNHTEGKILYNFVR